MAETAIVIPVPEVEPAVGVLQRRHTRAGAEGMPPHVTLLIPFADTAALPLEGVRAVVREIEPFDFELTETRRFATVLWIAPEPAAAFVALVEALAGAFPEYPPYGGAFADIVPHLTVAASGDARTLDAIERRIAPSLPIAARAEAALIVQHVVGRWLPHTTIPLGAA